MLLLGAFPFVSLNCLYPDMTFSTLFPPLLHPLRGGVVERLGGHLLSSQGQLSLEKQKQTKQVNVCFGGCRAYTSASKGLQPQGGIISSQLSFA